MLVSRELCALFEMNNDVVFSSYSDVFSTTYNTLLESSTQLFFFGMGLMVSKHYPEDLA